MTVKVVLTSKQRGGNHAPKFRPVNSNDLTTSERKIYRTTLEAINAIPEDTYRRLILNLMSPQQVQDDLITLLLNESEEIAKAIFAGYVAGAKDMAHRIRDSINKELKRLRSDLRLIGSDEAKKAKDFGIYDPFPWTGSVLPPDDIFNQQPDNMAGKVYSRMRANEIIVAITDDINANITAIVQEAFTAQQTFQTGRTVTGLTTEQTAGRIYGVLSASSPTPITTADYARYVVPHTNGLFPRWAKAVDRSMNNYANTLYERGLSEEQILERTSKHGERYGNKLRRSRARMIARTEIAYAQNRGMYDTLIQASDSSIMGSTAMKEWIVGPTDVCDICQPMGGRKIPVKDTFMWQGGSGQYPPAHPNCRCFTAPVPQLNAPPQFMGTGIPSDPFRYVMPGGMNIPTV